MHNNKGLTLIELLAVLIVIGLIAMIITPNVTKNLRESQSNLCYNQLDSIMDAAENWLTDQIDRNTEVYKNLVDGNEQEVTAVELKTNGYMSGLDDKYNNVKVKITKHGNNFTYEFASAKSVYCNS